jgi:cytochrome bd-type quinol oxidase subunit 2
MYLYKKNNNLFVTTRCNLLFVFIVPTAHATDINKKITQQVNTGASVAGFGLPQDPRVAAATLIQILLGLLGSVFMVLIIMSGYWYITARGRSDMIEKATDTMRRAVIGIIVVMMAYSINTLSRKSPANSHKAGGKRMSSSTGVIDTLFMKSHVTLTIF